MHDRLAPLLTHFDLHARVVAAGQACGLGCAAPAEGLAHLHLLRRGRLRWQLEGQPEQAIAEPALLLFAQPAGYRLDSSEAELVCATLDLGAQFGNPLLHGLPGPWVLPLADLGTLQRLLELFFDEAFAQRCGRQAALDRMAELLVIELMRLGFSRGLLKSGVLAGLGDARLAKALTAMHEQPAHAWSLERLAAEAGMSRARFAAHFGSLVGVPPGDYLTSLRIGLAKRLLLRHQPLKSVAESVGYGSAAALARAFQQRVGLAPGAWREAKQATA